jgi:hypothetical protein
MKDKLCALIIALILAISSGDSKMRLENIFLRKTFSRKVRLTRDMLRSSGDMGVELLFPG